MLLLINKLSSECWKQVAVVSSKQMKGYTYGGGFCWQDCPANQDYQYNFNFYCVSNALSYCARATAISVLVAGKLDQDIAKTV